MKTIDHQRNCGDYVNDAARRFRLGLRGKSVGAGNIVLIPASTKFQGSLGSEKRIVTGRVVKQGIQMGIGILGPMDTHFLQVVIYLNIALWLKIIFAKTIRTMLRLLKSAGTFISRPNMTFTMQTVIA
jgi:hypothetical protein